MAETNPVGVPVAPSGDGVSVEDAATQILQSGLLDEDEYIPSQNRDHAVEKAVEQEEDEEESDDSDAEQPEEDSEEEPDEEEANEEPTYTIKLNGKTERVSLDELTNGYQRGADYTHKTQELSRSRKEFDAERQAVANERGQYQNALAQFQQILVEQHAPYENIDWAELAEIDPTAYVIKKQEQSDRRTPRKPAGRTTRPPWLLPAGTPVRTLAMAIFPLGGEGAIPRSHSAIVSARA